jgi:hypothetical protein
VFFDDPDEILLKLNAGEPNDQHLMLI